MKPVTDNSPQDGPGRTGMTDGPAAVMDSNQLRKLHEFMGQFNLTLWVDRDKVWSKTQPATIVAKTALNKNNSSMVSKPVGGVEKLEGLTGTDKSTPVNTQPKNELGDDTLAADTNKNPAKQEQKPLDVSQTKNATTKLSLRLGALLYGNVLVVYSLKNRIGIVQDERELLNRMLDKCGVNMQEYRFTKETILVYPPLIKNLEEILSQDVNALQNLVAGFMKALSDKSRQATGQDLYMLIVGDNVTQYLPEHKKITHHAPIILDSLRVMLDEPQRRKVAWEQLKPLRDTLAASNAEHVNSAS